MSAADPPPCRFRIRPALNADIADLEALIARSARGLSQAHYRSAQIEAALAGAFGVDSTLIADGTLFVAATGERLLGCGGWSFRSTLFGGDRRAGRDPSRLDPSTEAARIRAFFVDPLCARRGIGSALLAHCEQQAQRHGFQCAELLATLPGARLYAARGYAAGPAQRHVLGEGETIAFIPMRKRLVLVS